MHAARWHLAKKEADALRGNHWSECPDCFDYLFKDGISGYYIMQGAFASVGIEHDRNTDEMMCLFMAAYHNRGHHE